jgi:hypothetical protein
MRSGVAWAVLAVAMVMWTHAVLLWWQAWGR